MFGKERYDELGAGCPVVLIHGFPLCRQMWQPQMVALADAGCRVICPDLPGFGASPLEEAPATMSSYADSVIELLDELEIEQAVIGGMSMGGYVLLDLLKRYPQRLLGAVFLVTRASADDDAAKQKRTALAAQVDGGNRLIVPETFAQVLFAPQTEKRQPELIARVRQWMEAASQEGTSAALLAMRDRDDSVANLANYSLPALVVGGAQDKAVPREHSEVLANALPNARLVVIPEAGHMANLEQPELCNAALLEFLQPFL